MTDLSVLKTKYEEACRMVGGVPALGLVGCPAATRASREMDLPTSEVSSSSTKRGRFPDHVVLYRGPSTLNGKPIIMVEYGVNRINNHKLGRMIEVAVFPADMLPSEAAKAGDDAAVCGDCPGRPANHGYCYVQVAKEVDKTWEAAHNLPVTDLAEACRLVRESGLPIRFGTYGDCAAVPFEIVEALAIAARGPNGNSRHTGFTHQRSHSNFDPRMLKYLSASIEFPEQGDELRRQFPGVKTYRIGLAESDILPNERLCPGGPEPDDVHCCDCLSCSGMCQTGSTGDRFTVVHGSKAKVAAFKKYVADRTNIRHVHPDVIGRLSASSNPCGYAYASGGTSLAEETREVEVDPAWEEDAPEQPGRDNPPEEGVPEVVVPAAEEVESSDSNSATDSRSWCKKVASNPDERSRDGDHDSVSCSGRPASGWWTHSETAEYLRVQTRTLAARMKETPRHIKRPWINYGTAGRPYYSWLAAGVDAWWIEVNEWRQSKSAITPIACAGGIREGRRGAAAAQTSRPRAGSKTRSSERRPKDEGGSLTSYVKSLGSKRS